jgi:hypothetical protein
VEPSPAPHLLRDLGLPLVLLALASQGFALLFALASVLWTWALDRLCPERPWDDQRM